MFPLVSLLIHIVAVLGAKNVSTSGGREQHAMTYWFFI